MIRDIEAATPLCTNSLVLLKIRIWNRLLLVALSILISSVALFLISRLPGTLEARDAKLFEICKDAPRAVVAGCDLFPEFGPCAANAGERRSWDAELDCRFANAFVAQRQSEEVFVVRFSSQNKNDLHNSCDSLAQSTIKAIHLWARQPVILIMFDVDETPEMFTPIEFPRLIVLHMRKGTDLEHSGAYMLKTRAFLMGLMGAGHRTVISVDVDAIVGKGIDRLFKRAREEITDQYPYPIGPTHWMSRVPGNDEYGIFAVPCSELPCDRNVTTCNPAGINLCRNRPVRWMQTAIFTFTEKSAPFLVEMYKFPQSGDDEYDMNTKLWAAHAHKQWCHFIPWLSEAAVMYEPQVRNLDAITRNADKLYFPYGIPKVMIAVHGETNPSIAAKWVRKVSEYEETHMEMPLEDRELIYYGNKMWTKKDWILQNMPAETPCILPI